MTQNGDLGAGTRRAIKFGICLLLVGQVVIYLCLYLLRGELISLTTDSRALILLIPAFLYLLVSDIPSLLSRSAGIRRQAIHLANWWLAFGIWQFAAGMGRGPSIALLAIGAVIAMLSVKDAVRIPA